MAAEPLSEIEHSANVRQPRRVSVVIPSYNMAWCLPRAIKSCQSQSFSVDEIIVVDDCSLDNTKEIVEALAKADPRVKYVRSERNGGPLAALRIGVQQVSSDWVALLDADDELTPQSIAARIHSAECWERKSGRLPQLAYGDLAKSSGVIIRFTRLEGDAFPFISRELCLCQTSTIMLGRQCLKLFPASNNPWCTDDEIVLSVSKHFPIVHSGEFVAIYHDHESNRTRNALIVYQGVSQLVRERRDDIMHMHGVRYLLLWRLRVLKALLDFKIKAAEERITIPRPILTEPFFRFLLKGYRSVIGQVHHILRMTLRSYFDLEYF